MASAYERRNAKAQAAGWKNYPTMRRAAERVNSDSKLSSIWSKANVGSAGSATAKDLRIFYGAFVADTRHDMGVDSYKAKWFVGVTEQVGDYNEWERLYGRND